MSPNRMLDPAIGRFWGVDALSDLMPAISPMAYSYNNPVFFNDPLGLMGIPGCDECPDDAQVLDEVVVTASRLPKPDFSALLNSINPIYRNIGMQGKKGNQEYLQQAFNQTPIQYGEGLGYTTQFQQGINTIGEGVSSSLVYASFGAMAAPVVAYGSPYLFKGISIADKVTGGAITRIGVEGFSQITVNVMRSGFRDGLAETDFADITLAGLGMNFVVTSALGASVNLTTEGFSFAESPRAFTRDFTLGLITGGQYKALQRSEISKAWIEIFNGFNTVKAKGLGAVSDQVGKE